MCPYAGLPAKTTTLPPRFLLSSGSRVRILPGALIKSPVQRLYGPVGHRCSLLVSALACQARASCLAWLPGLLERDAGQAKGQPETRAANVTLDTSIYQEGGEEPGIWAAPMFGIEVPELCNRSAEHGEPY